ncbi:MAG TPA: HNH endonuclease signature motif containing protein [Polyangiaceae bacterium]|jgi:hypothetical protein|nr:HNH endonuclease signature motif containing protein [Polyangiaceae bacterium]
MGQYESGLKSLADDQLLSGLASIVGRRNQITAEFLAYLAELDERQLFLALGYSSLFEYCVEKLGLCESTAGRHIGAARVCRDHPEVFAMVASGALHASALSLMRKHLTPENAKELFERCSRRSTRKVEELLAARFPRQDVKDLVRRLPARGESTLDVGGAVAQSPPSSSCEQTNTNVALSRAPTLEQAVRLVAPQWPEAQKPRQIEALSSDRYGVHFTADGEFCALLERVRGLAGHRLPGGDLMTLLERGLEAYERELERGRFAVGRKVRRSRESMPSSGGSERVEPQPLARGLIPPALAAPEFAKATPLNSAAPVAPRPRSSWKRRCTAEVARAVFLRDGKQCTYVSPDGRRCGARRCLELDHIEPVAAGGEATIENLRLRCRAHNQWYARQYFGKLRVNAAIHESRRRRAGGRQHHSRDSDALVSRRLGEHERGSGSVNAEQANGVSDELAFAQHRDRLRDRPGRGLGDSAGPRPAQAGVID